MSQPNVYGAVEAGGTKFICAVATGAGAILAERSIPTGHPEQTLAEVERFFISATRMFGRPKGVGVAGFGPLQLRRSHPNWGRLLNTPKPGWSGASLIEPLQKSLPGCPIEIDTDVNAAALAEMSLDPHERETSVVYVTVGTGIGGGAMHNGEPIRGALHPEMGHIRVRRDPRDDQFSGCCPYHADCIEGLASGRAIRERWGCELGALGSDHHASSVIGGYLGQLAASISLMLSPDRIVFGGGVIRTPGLLPHIRTAMRETLNDYLPPPPGLSAIEGCVSISKFLGRSGLLGAILLAQRAAQTDSQLAHRSDSNPGLSDRS